MPPHSAHQLLSSRANSAYTRVGDTVTIYYPTSAWPIMLAPRLLIAFLLFRPRAVLVFVYGQPAPYLFWCH